MLKMMRISKVFLLITDMINTDVIGKLKTNKQKKLKKMNELMILPNTSIHNPIFNNRLVEKVHFMSPILKKNICGYVNSPFSQSFKKKFKKKTSHSPQSIKFSRFHKYASTNNQKKRIGKSKRRAFNRIQSRVLSSSI